MDYVVILYIILNTPVLLSTFPETHLRLRKARIELKYPKSFKNYINFSAIFLEIEVLLFP